MYRTVRASEAKEGKVYETIRGRKVKVVKVEKLDGDVVRATVESVETGNRFLLPPDYPLREKVEEGEAIEEPKQLSLIHI